MKTIIASFSLLFLFAVVNLRCEELPGIPVFSDDFSVRELFVENWESSKSVKNEDGKVVIPSGNTITLRRIPEGDFVFTADITVEKPDGKDPGHCGVRLEGWINLMITPSLTNNTAIANTAYRVPGEERSRGKTAGLIPDFEFGKPVRIMVSREKVGESQKYSYTVNGRPVDSFTAENPGATGKIEFYGYRTSILVDNFNLYALQGTGSRNLVVNSSFEHLQEGMPIYMKPLTARKFRFEGKWEDFMKAFAIDDREKVSGKQSVRMTLDSIFPGPIQLPSPFFSCGVGTHDVSVTMEKPVTFSVYLKASEDNFPVTLGIWELWRKGHSKNIKVSKEWQRYSFTIEKPEQRAIVRGNVSFKNPGTLWADDMQIEIGSEMTPYMPSSLDRDKFAASREEIPVEADIILQKTPKAPVIDGVIEDLWLKHGNRTDRFFIKGSEKPKNMTEAWLMCDADNLYLAVRAHVTDISAVRGSSYALDNLAIHSEDCIEVLLDTSLGRKEYYHLTVNAAGSKTDMGPGRVLAWNGEWDAAARINEKESCIDYEMRYPLSNFAGLDMADRWGINIGRNDTANQQFPSLTHTKEVNFHLPALYPAIVFPEGVIDKYKISVRDLYLVAGKDGKICVSGTVGNMTGEIMDAEILVADAGTGEILGRQNVKIDSGNTEIVIPVTVIAGVRTMDCTVKLLVDGRLRFSQAKRIILKRQLELYTRYNYYMNEKEAVLVGLLNLPGADKMTGRITVAGKKFSVKMSPEFALNVPLEGIADGEHTVILDVYSGAEKVTSGTAGLIKRPFRAGATQIDRQRRCLVVDGRPYLVIAPFFGMEPGLAAAHQEAVIKNMLRLHKEMGYRCFLVGAKDSPPFPEQTQMFYDLCEKEGVKIIHWAFEGWKNRESIMPEQRFNILTSGNIIAWMIVDEPELGLKSEDVEAYMAAHIDASPYTPVFMNNTIIGIPGRFANLKTDILMLDDYLTNRENRKVVEMIEATNMMMEAGREEHKPVFYFLAGENLDNHYRELTYSEQVAQTYGVIIAGARGVSYFCSLPFYPEDYRACVDVNRELLSLENVIFSLEKTSDAAISDSAVISITRKMNDKIYIIALNQDNDRAADAEITLPVEFRYTADAELKFEGRKVKVRNGKIHDRFSPLERHVYVVDIAK